MAGLLPPVIATLLADTKEYTAKMDEATGKMEEFGAASDTTGGKFGSFASKASTAIIGVGVAFAAYATDEALKFQEALDKVQNTTNVTTKELSHISSESLKISDATGQTAVNIVGAYGAVEAAGYKRAAADKAVTAAAKLTLIAGGDVVANTQSLIAAQNLGITKGMSAAKVADLLTIALKGNEGGLSGVVSLLVGKGWRSVRWLPPVGRRGRCGFERVLQSWNHADSSDRYLRPETRGAARSDADD